MLRRRLYLSPTHFHPHAPRAETARYTAPWITMARFKTKDTAESDEERAQEMKETGALLTQYFESSLGSSHRTRKTTGGREARPSITNTRLRTRSRRGCAGARRVTRSRAAHQASPRPRYGGFYTPTTTPGRGDAKMRTG